MALILSGQVAPLDPNDPTAAFPGKVYLADPVPEAPGDGASAVPDAGRVVAVRTAGDPPPGGFSNAPEIDLGSAFLYPGLIDLHSHIGYNSLPLWTEPTQPTPFVHHDRWPRAASYQPRVSWPAYLLASGAPEALLVYVQVRALAGGTTAIQGWPNRNRNPVNKLLRSVEDEELGTGEPNLIRTSALTLDDDELMERAEFLEGGGGFIYHCGEGQRGSLVTRELDDLADTNCLRRKLIAIHLNSVDGTAFERWKQRAELAGDDAPGTVVWSPFSNLWLYGPETTDVTAARQHGVTVALGTDWGPSGTKNLLGELKVARLWSEHAGLGLSAFDLAEMVTAAPGDTLARCWPAQGGRLVPGALADVAVIDARHPDPWENLVRAREEDVLLVLVGGRARLGTKELMDAAGERATTSVDLGNDHYRRVRLVEPENPERQWYWIRALERLDEVRRDPAGAMDTGRRALAAVAGKDPAEITTADPLVLELDMPGPGGVRAGPPPDPAGVDVPDPPSLRHDLPWRAEVKRNPFHGGILDELDRFYL